MEALDTWLERQRVHAARAMLRSVSAIDIVKTRPGFGQTMRPRPGSIVASPVLASYDPDPDYFFHWFRDSAVVIDALRLLFEDGLVGPQALRHLADFIDFSLALQQLDGRRLVAAPAWRGAVAPDFQRFVRDDAELAAVHGSAVAAEARVNPDGSLDISKWSRPQHDGPPLRALVLLRWARTTELDGELLERLERLVRADLDFVRERWRLPSVDIWEEELGMHYYTLRTSAAALDAGAGWLAASGEATTAQACAEEAQAIGEALQDYWLADAGHYRSRILEGGRRSAKELDIALILAAIHAPGSAAHGPQDPRMQATLGRLEELFRAAYPINHGLDRPGQDAHAVRRGPAMGRYAGDVYYAGGAYFFATLGAAEFCFRAAQSGAATDVWYARGEAYLETVRACTPPSGDMAEQFDQRDGTPASARHLAWSYAAFLTCEQARRTVLADS
jgi:glucoamylase